MNRNKSGAYSLIELLVVIAIIGILSTIAIPSYKKNVRKAQVAKALQSLVDLAKDLKLTYTRTGSMPVTLSFSGVTIGNNTVNTGPFADFTKIYFVINGSKFVIDGYVKDLSITGGTGIRVYNDASADAGISCGGGNNDTAAFLYPNNQDLLPASCRINIPNII